MASTVTSLPRRGNVYRKWSFMLVARPFVKCLGSRLYLELEKFAPCHGGCYRNLNLILKVLPLRLLRWYLLQSESDSESEISASSLVTVVYIAI